MTRPPGPSITCPRCGRTSYSPGDIAQKYCGWCHWWTSDSQLGRPEVIADAERQGAITPLPVVPQKVVTAHRWVLVTLGVVLAVIVLDIYLAMWGLALLVGSVWIVCFLAHLWGRRQLRTFVAGSSSRLGIGDTAANRGRSSTLPPK